MDVKGKWKRGRFLAVSTSPERRAFLRAVVVQDEMHLQIRCRFLFQLWLRNLTNSRPR
jgi:hypothetical protein